MFKIIRFLKNQDGATAIEYGLIAALITVAALGAITSTGTSVEGLYNSVGEKAGDAMNKAGQ